MKKNYIQPRIMVVSLAGETDYLISAISPVSSQASVQSLFEDDADDTKLGSYNGNVYDYEWGN